MTVSSPAGRVAAVQLASPVVGLTFTALQAPAVPAIGFPLNSKAIVPLSDSPFDLPLVKAGVTLAVSVIVLSTVEVVGGLTNLVVVKVCPIVKGAPSLEDAKLAGLVAVKVAVTV